MIKFDKILEPLKFLTSRHVVFRYIIDPIVLLTLSLYHSWVFVYICTFILVSFFFVQQRKSK